jgi:ectoine hydroxylase-related dioxygenase (phytanoyl-CoA dioxygenase family)
MNERAAQYEQDGFCQLPDGTINSALLSAAQAALVAVRDGRYDTGVPPSSHPGYDAHKLCKINDAHLASVALYDLLVASDLGAQIAAVTGSERVQVWASQLLIKPPGSAAAGHVGWHQDRQYWQYWDGEEGLFTAWIALSDVGEDAGPMRFVRGSQRWGFLGQGDFFSADQAGLQAQISTAAGAEWEEVAALLPAGGVSLHHCLTFHGSHANTSAGARCSLAVHLRDERATPVPGSDNYYVSHLDEPAYSPVIYGDGAANAAHRA